MSEVEVIKVIRTDLTLRGNGIQENPHRRVEQFWSLDGKLLAENDPCLKPVNAEWISALLLKAFVVKEGYYKQWYLVKIAEKLGIEVGTDCERGLAP